MRIISFIKAIEDLHQLQEDYILTSDTEEILNIENKVIKVVPVWKWLLT